MVQRQRFPHEKLTIFDLLSRPKSRDAYPVRCIAALPQSEPALRSTAVSLRNLVLVGEDSRTVAEMVVKGVERQEETRTLAHVLAETVRLIPNGKPEGLSQTASVGVFQNALCSVALEELYKTWESVSEARYISLSQIERMKVISMLCADLSASGAIPHPKFLQCLRRVAHHAARTKNLEIMAIFAAYLLSRACTATKPHSIDAQRNLPTWVWTMFLRDIDHIVRLNERSHVAANLKIFSRCLGFSDPAHAQRQTLRAFASGFISSSGAIPSWHPVYLEPADAAKIKANLRNLKERSDSRILKRREAVQAPPF